MYKLLVLAFLVILTGCSTSKITIVSEVGQGQTVDKNKSIYIDKRFVKTEEDRIFIKHLEKSLEEHQFKLSNVIDESIYLFSYRVRNGGSMEKIIVPVTSFSTGYIDNTSFSATTTHYVKKNQLLTVRSINMSISTYNNKKVIELWTGRIVLSNGETFDGNEKTYIDEMVEKLAKNVEITNKKIRLNQSIRKYRDCVISNVSALADAMKQLDEIIYRVDNVCHNRLIDFVNAASIGKSNTYRNSYYESVSGGLPNEIRDDYYRYIDSKR